MNCPFPSQSINNNNRYFLPHHNAVDSEVFQVQDKMMYDNLKWFVDDAIEFNSKWVYQMYTVTQLGGLQDNVSAGGSIAENCLLRSC